MRAKFRKKPVDAFIGRPPEIKNVIAHLFGVADALLDEQNSRQCGYLSCLARRKRISFGRCWRRNVASAWPGSDRH